MATREDHTGTESAQEPCNHQANCALLELDGSDQARIEAKWGKDWYEHLDQDVKPHQRGGSGKNAGENPAPLPSEEVGASFLGMMAIIAERTDSSVHTTAAAMKHVVQHRRLRRKLDQVLKGSFGDRYKVTGPYEFIEEDVEPCIFSLNASYTLKTVQLSIYIWEQDELLEKMDDMAVEHQRRAYEMKRWVPSRYRLISKLLHEDSIFAKRCFKLLLANIQRGQKRKQAEVEAMDAPLERNKKSKRAEIGEEWPPREGNIHTGPR